MQVFFAALQQFRTFHLEVAFFIVPSHKLHCCSDTVAVPTEQGQTRLAESDDAANKFTTKAHP